MTSPFDPRYPDDVQRLVADYPLAWVVSHSSANFGATPLPLLAECDGDGKLASFFGHFALRNPQVAQLKCEPRAQILFMGPQGYISPSMAGDPAWGPTWNYAAARFLVDVEFLPSENDTALKRLVEKAESDIGGTWTVDQLGSRYDQLAPHIVAFRATVIEENATFKLGQDERPEVWRSIIDTVPNPPLAHWMRGQSKDQRA